MWARVRGGGKKQWGVLALLVAFIVAGTAVFWNTDGQDLASSYVGCRLVATGNIGALYTHDSDNFADVGDMTGTWQRLGAQGNFHGYLHPYVQTPLWAYALQPLCNRTSFPVFQRIFLVLTMLALAGTVFLVGRYWAPGLLHPLAIATVLVGLWFSQPFQYAMFLLQTHALFVFLTVAGLVLAERGRWGWAGFCIACAAAVKVTPGVFLLYWLLTRRWKAAGSMAFWSAVLMGATYVALGSQVMAAYVSDLQRVSRVLLVAQNNQSFAAWVMARFYGPDEVFDITILPLPTAVRWGSTLLLLGWTVGGGLLDARRSAARQTDSDAKGEPFVNGAPLGAVGVLVAMTIFAPIAWTHYSILLVVPLMVLVAESQALRNWWIGAVCFAVAALNYRPLATDVIRMDISDVAVVRGQFFAGVLCLSALMAVVWLERKREGFAGPLRAGGHVIADAVGSKSASMLSTMLGRWGVRSSETLS